MPKPRETDDPRILEERARIRERVRRCRERKAMERKLAGTLAAVAAAQPPVKPGAKQTLLKTSLLRHGITVDRIIETRAQALTASKLKRVGGREVEVADSQARLRASELLDKDLQRAGEMPEERYREVPAIVVNVLMLREDEDGLVANPVTGNLSGRRVLDVSPEPSTEEGV